MDEDFYVKEKLFKAAQMWEQKYNLLELKYKKLEQTVNFC